MSRHGTPLRYPGGKQRLAPFIAEIMTENGLEGGDYVEPYAGGAGVGIELLLAGVAGRIHLNDASQGVYDFWRSILTKPEEFCRRIAGASLTVEEWKRQKHIFTHPREYDQLDRGFSLFFLNRCNRSGIATAGVIGGLKQTGTWKLDARFPRNELIRRVEAIAGRRSDVSVKNLDAEEFVQTYLARLPKSTLVYLDPPYYHKADRLYFDHYKPEDHARIADVIQTAIVHPWVVSYDGVPEIIRLYSARRSFLYDLQYHASRAYKGREVFFFADGMKIPPESEVPAIDAALPSMKYQ